MYRIFTIIFCLALASCANVRPNNATDYTSQLLYPEETENFVVIRSKVYDEPLLGSMIEYTNKQYSNDNIDLYVYPIDHYTWKNSDDTLKREMKKVLAEVDRAVEYGYYSNRGNESTVVFNFNVDDKQFSGLKSSFELTGGNNLKYYSNAYIFLDQDKFVKFRTTFNAVETVPWNGDDAVKELLPKLGIPGESEYMAEQRAVFKQQVTQNIINLFLQAAKSQETEEGGE